MADTTHRNANSDSALCLQRRVLLDHGICLIEKISSGGQGTVYRAMDQHSNPCAVKVIAKQISQRTGMVSAAQTLSVKREAVLLKMVKHPSSLQFLGFLEDEKHWYILTELLQGPDLFDLVCSSSFTENEILMFARQLCHLLHYLHTHGIAHRDVKLENVMCVQPKSMKVKLIDYGLAHSNELDGFDLVSSHPGTLVYKAPELVRGDRDFDPRPSDMWSLGSMIYTACSGEYAFKGDSNDILAESILHAPVEFSAKVFSKVTLPTKNLIEDLLKKCPTKRLTAAQALKRIDDILLSRVVRQRNLTAPNGAAVARTPSPEPGQTQKSGRFVRTIEAFKLQISGRLEQHIKATVPQ